MKNTPAPSGYALTHLSLSRCRYGETVPRPPTCEERMRAFHLETWRAQFGNARFGSEQNTSSAEEVRNEQP